jgi:hypothetical protein
MAQGLRPVQVISQSSAIGGGLGLTTVQVGPTVLGSLAMGQQEATVAWVKAWDAPSASAVLDPATMTLLMEPVQTYVVPGNAAGAGSNIQAGGSQLPVGGFTFSNGLVLGFSNTLVAASTSGLSVNNQVVVSMGIK